MESKAVLLDKSQVSLSTMVNDQPNLSTSSLHVTSSYAEATNGKVCLRVPHTSLDVADFPEVPAGERQGIDTTGVLLNPSTIAKAAKNIVASKNIPILECLHLSVDADGDPHLMTTDLDTQITVRQRKIDKKYPDTDQCFEATPMWLFSLNAKQLKLLVDWAVKHGTREQYGAAPTIRFATEPGTNNIRVTIPREDNQEPAIGVISPYQGKFEKEQLRNRGCGAEESTD